jgi:hypothetical protein
VTTRISSSLAALGMVAAPSLMKLAERHPSDDISERRHTSDRSRGDGDSETEPASPHCGVERWSIKVGSDGDARDVDLRRARDTTIDALRSLPQPDDADPDLRLAPTEDTVFVLRNVKLTQYKREADSDYHLVLEDGHGKTVIAEIPEPGCLSHRSPWRRQVRAARDAFDGAHEVSNRMRSADDVVSLVGVGFFDVIHGQTGVAPNGIELHPVLDICFGQDCDLALAGAR